MLQYVRRLRFEETPDYNNLYKLLSKIAKNNGFIIDRNLDWIKEKIIPKGRMRKVIYKSNGNEFKSSIIRGDKSEYITNQP